MWWKDASNPERSAIEAGWRPRTLRPPYLLFLASVMTVMLLALEMLRQYSDIKGGLAFYDDTDDVPSHVTFAYNYGPTFIGLSLMTLWSFTVYDVFRLEPYFQLSKEQTFSADVLSANYIFGPFISTPISSARRKHWVVLGVSLINILVQLMLPSILSALLDLDSVPMSSNTTLRSWPDLVAVGEQAEWISSQRNISLYSPTWGDPAETPSRPSLFAIPPIELPDLDSLSAVIWKLNHTVYWVDLTCPDLPMSSSPKANVTVSVGATLADQSNYSTLTYALNDLHLASPADQPGNCTLNANYSGIFDLTATPVQARRWELDTMSCASVDVYGFLLDIDEANSRRLLAPTESPPAQDPVTPKAQLFSCGMEYYKANAEISMQANSTVVAVVVDKSSASALDSSQLDIAGTKAYLKKDICRTGNVCPSGNGTLTNQSLGRCDLGIESHKAPCSISAQYTQVSISRHEFISKIRTDMKLSFARLLTRLFNTNAAYTPVQGVGASDQVAVLVITFPAIASEIILLLGAVTCVFLAVFYRSRENILKADPGSIAAMFSIVAHLFNPAGVQEFAKYTDKSTARQLNRKLRTWRCYWYQEPSGQKLGFLPGEAPSRTLREKALLARPTGGKASRPDARLHFLSKPIFVAELLGLLAVICFMAVMFILCSKDRRLRRLSDSASDRLSIAFGILPSLIASMMRTLFNSIYLNLGILEPWIHLQKGGVDAKNSLLLNLSSQSPITVFFRSIRSRSFVLSLVSLCCIINTGLPAVLGALFTQSRTAAAWPTWDVGIRYNDSTILHANTIPTFFPYGLIESTLLNSVSSLPWTSPDYSFIPFAVHTDNMDHTYQAVTLGIGADLNCHQVPLTQDILTNKYHEDSGTSSLTSRDSGPMAITPSISNVNTSEPYSIQLLAPSGVTDNGTLTVLSTNPLSSNTSSYPSLALTCHAIPRIQNFTIGFDPSGMLQYYYPSDDAITSGQLADNVTSNLANYHRYFLASIQGTSGNGTAADEPKLFPFDWPGALIKLAYQHMNPEQTTIDADDLTDATQQVYQLLFAIYFTLQRDIYLKPLPKAIINGDAQIMRPTWSIVRSLPSFIVALIMVTFMVVALVLVFITRYGKFKGPRVPQSLGSVLAWLADSPILSSFYGTYDWSSDARRDHLIALDKRYIFRMITTPYGEQRWVIEEDIAEEKVEEAEEAVKAGKAG
ncbi:hypothetical protein BDV26DRAFT_264412 [Aspergillus bertholletiae]|uniref:Uncharacterized protein n=1 Tax=Aspergillus bertholletiae TaxID=1226010 RepID=A0A5N7B512_9EURO|nr:hypothetical protein BDV26DRAFT_264412 [Aspergillus bertholletiae]